MTPNTSKNLIKTKNENYKQDLEKCLKNIETFGEIDSLKKIPTNNKGICIILYKNSL